MPPPAVIQTVTGPIPADQLGVTLGHEHLRFRDDAVAANWPGRYDDGAAFAAAVEMLELARSYGVRSVVDPTAMNAGRDVRFLERASRRAGVQVVACTGIYTFDALPIYFDNRDVETMAAHFVEDLERGIQGTDRRAAFIKVAADLQGLTEGVVKVHRAAALASRQTGAPIMAHSCPAAGNGPKQVELFIREGVDPAKVQICHYGDTTDLGAIEDLVTAGVYVGLDRFGSPFAPFTDARCRVAAELLRRGHGDRLILSHDFCATIDWFTPDAMAAFVAAGEPNPHGVGLLFERVLPYLRAQGAVDAAVQERLLVANPRRWLVGA